MDARRYPFALRRAWSAALLSFALSLMGCADESKIPRSGSDAGEFDSSHDAAARDAETIDAEGGAPPDAYAPPTQPATDASARDANVIDAATLDSGYFTPQDCAACTRQVAANVCSGFNTVHWECFGNLYHMAAVRLGALCVDRATAIPRWCCPPDVAPECP